MKVKQDNGNPVLCAESAEAESRPIGSGPGGNVLPFVPPLRVSVAARRRRCPDQVLAELLALNEEMIAQLRGERSGMTGTADFLTGTIKQHEKAAALLRAELDRQAAAPG